MHQINHTSKKYLLYFIYLFIPFAAVYSQGDSFVCNGDLYITLSSSSNSTNAFKIELDGAIATFGSVGDYSTRVNSTGFNSVDGYIYGITSSNRIIRLKSDDTYDDLGAPSFLPTSFSGLSAAGDFDANGIYWIHHRADDTYYGIDVNNGLTLVEELELRWHTSTGNSGKFDETIDDLVFDPLDKTSMYTYQRYGSGPTMTRGHLLRVNMDPTSPDYGFVYSEGALDNNVIVHMGAMFFDSQGQLFGYGAISNAGTGLNQNRLVRIDRNPTVANLVAIGPGASSNDGCSCPFSMFVTKATPDSYNVCLGEPILVNYEIGNTSTTNSDAVIFNDSFPTGFVIQDIIFEEFVGDVKAGTGIGTNKLTIENIDIVNQVVKFQVLVTPSLVSAEYKIYADLTNLPTRFGDVIYSDDPETFASNDPTIFIVDYEEFQNNFDIGDDISMCIGEVANLIASIPEEGTEITWSTGETGSAISTSEPGVIIAQAVFGACIDIDTVEVEVNEYPEIDLGENREVCLGDAQTLQVPFDSDYIYFWNTGETSSSINVNSSGDYSVIVDNKGCTSQEIVSIEYIFEEFEGQFEDVNLCEGEELVFNANSDLDVTYEWSLSNGTELQDSILVYEQIGQQDAGTLSLFMEYKECIFQEEIDISVNPLPTIELGEDVIFDICDSLKLAVEQQTLNTSIQWSPEELVDCQNCEEVTLMTTSQTLVIATVTDDIGCANSDSLLVSLEDTGRGDPMGIPNIFSPNGDGTNDFFIVRPLCYTIDKFEIFDRWGNNVYSLDHSGTSPEVRWDGENQIGDCAIGVYAWVGEFTFINSGQTKIIAGDVTIIR